jgi:hypothetical protein
MLPNICTRFQKRDFEISAQLTRLDEWLSRVGIGVWDVCVWILHLAKRMGIGRERDACTVHERGLAILEMD